MAYSVVPKPEYTALLSAASLGHGGNSGALLDIAGQSLLHNQVSALYCHGISTFLIEVDSIPGELLSLADGFRQLGARVEFVRTVKDMKAFLKPSQKLVIQAESHYFSASMVGKLLTATGPFIATVDGRDENVTFERIDLNTRWAGFALINTDMARSMAELPEGWSMASSLLRLAVQHDARFEAIGQNSIQTSEIANVSGPADAERIVMQMLAGRSARSEGFIEKYVFGNLARALAPSIWRLPYGPIAISYARAVCAVGGICFAMLGWSIGASILVLLSVFFHSFWDVINGFGKNQHAEHWQKPLLWSLVAASALIIAWTDVDYGTDTLAFVTISAGLALLAQKISLPRWSAGILKSPAFMVIAMLIVTMISVVEPGAKMFAIAQVGLLVASLYWPDERTRNSNQA